MVSEIWVFYKFKFIDVPGRVATFASQPYILPKVLKFSKTRYSKTARHIALTMPLRFNLLYSSILQTPLIQNWKFIDFC